MKHFLLILTFLILCFPVFSQSARERTRIAEEIRSVLLKQVSAWNRGDIQGFMRGYYNSEKLVFISGDNITRGWSPTLERYKRNYDSREKMGVLSFSDLEFTFLSRKAAVVIGSWSLERANDRPHGKFSLVFRRFKKGWRIILDHTS
ncbi:MAG: YybH family protein [Pyrinomonadaceae bacterium]|jgi:ketosteroid isomerase-like protein